MKTPVPRTRNRLSSIDLLPPEAEEDVVWAYKELRRRKMIQDDVLDQFNLRLRMKGLGPISKSAFSRAAIRLSRMATRLEETREIAGVLAEKFETGGGEDITLLLGETIKVMTFEMLENAGRLKADGDTAEMLMNAARALKTAEDARRVSADTASKLKREFAVKAEEAVERVGAARGLSSETVTAMKAELFGRVLPKPEAGRGA